MNLASSARGRAPRAFPFSLALVRQVSGVFGVEGQRQFQGFLGHQRGFLQGVSLSDRFRNIGKVTTKPPDFLS